jgi:hypothetical protein
MGFVYISFLLGFFWKQWTTKCIRELSIWLAVYEVIVFLQLVRSLFLRRMWKIARDPALIQAQVNCCFSLVLLFEIGWCIYGNTFIYTSGSEYCTGNDGRDMNAYALWVSALIVMCWGYCLMLYLLGIIIFALGLCCIYRSWSLELTKQ